MTINREKTNFYREKIEYFCAYQERYTKEVIKKLEELEIEDTAIIEDIIVQLQKDNFLDDTRYSKLYSRSKFNQKKWGKIKIRQELRKKDLNTLDIEKGLQEIDADLYEKTLENLVRKQKEKYAHLSSFQQKQKIWNYLNYRGWESDLIFSYLTDL